MLQKYCALFYSITLLLLSSFVQANTTTKDIPQQCNQLFKETEKLISEAEKQPGIHPQISDIKNQLQESKKQILGMESDTQAKSCDRGLLALNQLTKQN